MRGYRPHPLDRAGLDGRQARGGLPKRDAFRLCGGQPGRQACGDEFAQALGFRRPFLALAQGTANRFDARMAKLAQPRGEAVSASGRLLRQGCRTATGLDRDPAEAGQDEGRPGGNDMGPIAFQRRAVLQRGAARPVGREGHAGRGGRQADLGLAASALDLLQLAEIAAGRGFGIGPARQAIEVFGKAAPLDELRLDAFDLAGEARAFLADACGFGPAVGGLGRRARGGERTFELRQVPTLALDRLAVLREMMTLLLGLPRGFGRRRDQRLTPTQPLARVLAQAERVLQFALSIGMVAAQVAQRPQLGLGAGERGGGLPGASSFS